MFLLAAQLQFVPRLPFAGKQYQAHQPGGDQHTDTATLIALKTQRLHADAAVENRHLRTFPCGVLREPPGAMATAEIIVVTRSDFSRDIIKSAFSSPGTPKIYSIPSSSRHWTNKSDAFKIGFLFELLGHC